MCIRDSHIIGGLWVIDQSSHRKKVELPCPKQKGGKHPKENITDIQISHCAFYLFFHVSYDIRSNNKVRLYGSGKKSPVDNTASQSDLIGILQFITNGDAPCYYAEFDTHLLQFTVDVEVGGISFHRGAQSEDDFLDSSFGYPLYETFYLQDVYKRQVQNVIVTFGDLLFFC